MISTATGLGSVYLAGFHDYYRQPRQATKYRAEAAALRKSMVKVTA